MQHSVPVMAGQVRIHWVERSSGVEGHGSAVAMEIAVDYMRRNRGTFPELDFTVRDAITGDVVDLPGAEVADRKAELPEGRPEPIVVAQSV